MLRGKMTTVIPSYCTVLGYLTTSDDQMWRVMPLKTPVRLLIRFITVPNVVTTINYNYLLRSYLFTQLTILHANIPFLTSSHIHTSLRNSTVKVKVKVTLRLMVSQSVSLGVEHHLGLMTGYLLLFDSYGLVFVGRPLWREDGSVFCICCWSLPAQSFSGPSPSRLATVFYCLWFETSLFVASYDAQGYGGVIRPRLHAVITQLLYL
jgi:hypothetical protein